MNEVDQQRALARTDGSAVAQLLHLAVEKGIGVEGLEKLVALQERVMARQAEADWSAAVATFQQKCPSIKKSSTAEIVTQGGSRFKYNYAELDEIAGTVNPILSELGLSYTWDSTLDEKILTCRCTLRHASGHAVTSSFTCPIDTTARMNSSQQAGAALTYARRQALVQVLGLTTTDPDTDGASGGASLGAISEGQAADMQALIEEVKADKAKFLAWLKVDSLANIAAKDHQKAVDALVKMRKR